MSGSSIEVEESPCPVELSSTVVVVEVVVDVDVVVEVAVVVAVVPTVEATDVLSPEEDPPPSA
ncbi:MAG TPA: hypothetical protein VG755_10515 [Nannocystaceae bacterium]|nr:hypothetical protein [Nannocystaceae bacterium]